MPLWLASVLFLIFVAGMITFLIFTRNKRKKVWVVISIIILGIVLFVILGYVILSLILIGSTSNQPADDLAKTTTTNSQIAVTTSTALETQPPMPDDYDFPIEQVPALQPDILGIRNNKYKNMPVFSTQNEVSQYVLYNFLNNNNEIEFYIKKDLATDEGTGFSILNTACDVAMTYYLFNAYELIDMYTEDYEYDDMVYAKILLYYSKPLYDLEAKAEAIEFIKKNPVPENGFKDFESEKKYAKKIHDFIAKKVTYSPIGNDPEKMLGLRNYQACQEAYNVLDENQTSAVCAGYARAFALISQYAGINCVWVWGNETETSSHSWNIIYPCDGSEPVLLDVTWDDTESFDVPHQQTVSDYYFYIPLSEEYEHEIGDTFNEFLKFINNK